MNKDINALKNMSGLFNKLVTKKKKGEVKALELKNVSFSIKKRLLLNKLSFSVNQGEIHGFLGPNGAGKTTTIKNIIDAYVSRSNNSEIKIMGYDAKTLEAKKQISYIPEYAAFPSHLDLEGYLKAMANFNGIGSVEAKKKANDLINILELQNHKNINPNKFSSGMKKKVLLAQALMSDPSILILDEPAANLDPAARNMFFKSIKDLSKQGITIFISSHILAELEGLIDSLTMINTGNIIYSGKVDNIAKNIQKGNKEVFMNIHCSKEISKDIIKLAKKLKLKFLEEALFLKVKANTKKKLFKMLEHISKNEIEISSIEFNKVTLQDIYDKGFVS